MANSGKDQRLWVSPSGVTTSGLLQVEAQGDLSIDPGIVNETTAFKDVSYTSQGKNGWSATIDINLRDPMPTGQAKLWDAHNNDTQLYIETKGVSGSMRWKGVVKVSMGAITNGVKGLRMCTVTLNEDGTMLQDTAP